MTTREKTSAAQEAIAAMLDALGIDHAVGGMVETPQRVAELYSEMFAGVGQDPVPLLRTGFEDGGDDLIVVRDIEFFSLCEHHLLPFYGTIQIGYIPRGRIVGIGTLARVTEMLARRPQVQERLTQQIVDALMEGIDALGAGVVVEARHLCLTMRGSRQTGSRLVTSALRGGLRDDPQRRSEFLGLLG